MKNSLQENMRRFGTKNLNEVDASAIAPGIATNNSCWDAKKYPILAGYIKKQNIDLVGLVKVAIYIAVNSMNPIDALSKHYTFFRSMNQQEITPIVNELKSFAKCIISNYSNML